MFNRAAKTLAAFFLYSAFAVYLYQPHFEKFDRQQYALIITAVLACIGCYILSRRWIASFLGSFFAGAIYGFGPFMLGLARFHPAVSVLAGSMPWLFLPAAFGPSGKLRALRVILSVLPFIVIIIFFQGAGYLRFFPVPKNARIATVDLVSFLSPLVAAKRGSRLIGFYHIPIASLIIGFAMLIKARRIGTIIIIAAGTTAAFCKAFLGVSSIIWIAIPSVCCAIIAGAGIDAFLLAGAADKKWIITIVIIMLLLAVATLLLASKYFQSFAGLGAGYARLFVESAKMYIVGAVIIGIIFCIARLQLRMTIVRGVLLCCALSADIFVGAQCIIDKVI